MSSLTKMKVSLVIIFFLIASAILSYSNGHITIEIEPNDVHQLSDILQTFIENHHVPTRQRSSLKCVIYHSIKTLSSGIIQLIGIMLSLVGANLLTMKLEHSTNSVNQIKSPTSMFNEECKHDFGCTGNICWRTCGDINNPSEEAAQKICFTSSQPNITNIQRCTYAYECSPCWSCSTPCTDGMDQ